MGTSKQLSRRISALLAPLALNLAGACGESTSVTSVTAPSTVSRCAITVQAIDGQVPAQGGSGTISVAAARDCTWTASSDAPWLSIRAGASGQGDGTVEFAAAANPDPATRRAAVVLNTQRAEITQAAASCVFSLAGNAASFGQAGGNGTIQVNASSAMCGWSAASDVEWINLRTRSGSGTSQIPFEVLPTTGPPRTGTVTIAEQKFSVTQAEGCAYAIAPTSFSAPAAGGAGSIAVTTTAGCPWTALSNAPWLTLSQASGAGPGAVAFSVAASAGIARTGTAVVAGQTFTVTQAPGCAYEVQPAAHAIGAGGGNLSLSVSTAASCPWTASSEVGWITLSTASGAGPASVTLTVPGTTGPSRSGAVTIAGQRVTVTQSAGCSYTIAPESATVQASGGSGTVTVTTAAGCAWTASSSASWLTIASGGSGSGNGEVRYSAAATTGPARSATLTIAGKTFTLNQGQGCSFTLAPASATIDDDGGQGTFTVQTAAGCGWTSESTVPWITITAGSSGTGEGQVRFTAARNAGPARSGAITAGGQTFTVQQGNGCAYSLSPTSQSVPAAGGNGTVGVTAGGGCSWTATSNAGWLTISSGSSGSGSGSVGFSAAANAGPVRSGTLTIGGRTFTVSQAEGCTFSIAPDAATVPASGGATSVSVTAGGGCSWTAASNAAWVRITGGASGSGNGSVQLSIDPHSGAGRTGTVTIAGRTFTVNQSAGCSYSIAPTAETVPAGGGPVIVQVTAPDGCGWTAVSNEAWLPISSGASGSGGGAVRVEVQPNAGAGRTGMVTIAGQTMTVTQQSGCTYAVAPDVVAVGAAGGGARVEVTTGGTCGWTATSGAAWITVTAAGSGTGSGGVDLSMAANAGPARSGIVTVAGRPVTVNQASGCTYGLSAASQPMGAAGGNSFVNVTAGAGCQWTAISNASWIVATAGASGSGDGPVQFTVDPNATGAPRSGTITIAGLTFTVNQE